MTLLKYLKIEFRDEIEAHELPAFRGAIGRKMGEAHVLFHHHHADGLRYAYPLIQYKRIRKHPAMVCVGTGVEEMQRYLEQADWSVEISGRRLSMIIRQLDIQEFTLRLHATPLPYQLHQWIAFHRPDDWKAYQQINDPAERAALLERKLNNHILSMAKGVGWEVPGPLETRLTHLGLAHRVQVKNMPYTAFNVQVQTNAFLPNFLGLGGKVSLGFGTVRSLHKKTSAPTAET